MMKHATHSPFRPSTMWVILLLVIFSVQACGPKLDLNPTPGNGGFDGSLTGDTIDDITAEICLAGGGDSDGDGLCNNEEDPECIDDPYCYDDEDIVLDSMGDYKTGAWGRFLTGLGIAAAGSAVVVGVVGASGMAPRKGKDKWGWLNNLIQDNPEADGRGFLRLLDKNGLTLQDSLLDLDFADTEVFTEKNGQKWMMRMTQLKLTNETFSVFVNGQSLEAGKELMMCIGGRTALTSAGTQIVSDGEGGENTYPASNLTIRMKKEYTQAHKVRDTRNAFLNKYCNGPNGGVFMALATPKADEYFINALPMSVLSNNGQISEEANEGFDFAFTLKYVFEALPEDIGSSSPHGEIAYRKYNTAVTNGSNRHSVELTDTDDYNGCGTDACRMAQALGYVNNDVYSSADTDAGLSNQETQKVNTGLSNPDSIDDPTDRAFHTNLGQGVSSISSRTQPIIYVGPGGTVNYYAGGGQ